MEWVREIVKDAKALGDAGYEMDVDDLSERTGYMLTKKSEEPGSPVPGLVRNRGADQRRSASRILKNRNQADDINEKLLASAKLETAQAQAEDLKPLRDRLDQIMAQEDPGFRDAALSNLINELPEILIAMNADPQAARMLEQSMVAGLLNGWTEAAELQPTEGAAA